MQRSDFGAWGADLSEGQFAQALAALGVLVGASRSLPPDAHAVANELTAIAQGPAVPLPWRLSIPVGPNATLLPPIPARRFAEGWEAWRSTWSARLELHERDSVPEGFDAGSALTWLAEQLSHPDVSARSVYVRADEPAAEVSWQWPLRVGFLGDDRSAELRSQLTDVRKREDWLQPLVRLVAVGSTTRACDLLLVPRDLRATLATIAALPSPPRVDCIVVLGRVRGKGAHWYRELVGLRAAARTAGVAINHVTTETAEPWFTALIAALSHNDPIDVALVTASRHAERPAPFLTASRKLVEFSRLATQVRRMATRLGARAMRDREVEMADVPTAERVLGMGPGSRRLEEVAERMRSIAEEPGEHFLHESDMATAAAEIRAAAEAPTAAAAAPAPVMPPASRFVRAQVYETTVAEHPVRRHKSLRAGAPHEVVVSIGLPDEAWLAPAPTTPFPDELLPPTEETHELTVVFAEPRLLEEPAVAHITLPRSGNSTECRFHLPVSANATALDARVIVLHENRVLQTAVLRGPIAAGADGSVEGSITLEIETVVRLALTDLDQRTRFDAALVLNHTAGGAAGVTSVADDRARGIRVSPQMDAVINWIDGRLSDVANDKKSYDDGLEAEATVNLLRDFARYGRQLYNFIVKNQIGDGGLARGERLQIISAVPDARLPAELIYDHRAPAADAPLCPNAAESLRRGTCGDSCPKGAAEKTVVCPLGFWGLSRIIERHAHDPKLDEIVGAKDFAFRSERVSGRETLEIASAGLVAGSQRVEKTVAGGLKTICDAIIKGSQNQLEPVPTWKGWTKKLADAPASLLVLIVHTEMPDNAPLPRMEIGKASWLDVVDLDETHIRPDPSRPGPIVLLLGCETGAPEVEFAGFVAQCRDYGAAIVVAAGSKIHSVHAVPVAKQFVDTLRKEVKRDGATFGDVMRVVRREMLANGLPMVLSLTAYGDADWRLTDKVT